MNVNRYKKNQYKHNYKHTHTPKTKKNYIKICIQQQKHTQKHSISPK